MSTSSETLRRLISFLEDLNGLDQYYTFEDMKSDLNTILEIMDDESVEEFEGDELTPEIEKPKPDLTKPTIVTVSTKSGMTHEDIAEAVAKEMSKRYRHRPLT